MSRRREVARRGGAARDWHRRLGRADCDAAEPAQASVPERARSDGSATGRWRVGCVAAVVLATLAGSLVPVAPAAADEQPSIVKAYGLDWIQRVRDDAWPQPKEQRPVICLLDTGVAVTPDTPADDSNGPIVARLAIDGGSGLPQGNTFEHLHGTTMASVIAAPKNDWGTVGVFPQARIVSVRVTDGDATFITPQDMVRGARVCRKWSISTQTPVGSVVMAESRYDERFSDAQWWEAASTDIAAIGGAFVAAAGNDVAAQSLPPATTENVLVVSAGDELGQRCAFAVAEPSSGIRGPGCAVADGGPWPSGSSAATAAVGALVDALAALQPELGPAERVAKLRSVATTPDHVLQAQPLGTAYSVAAFDPGVSASPPTPLTDVPLVTEPATGVGGSAADGRASKEVSPRASPRTVLWRPTIKARWRRHRLTLVRSDSQPGIVAFELPRTNVGHLAMTRRRQTYSLAKRPQYLDAWATSKDGLRWRSLTSHVKVAR